MGAVAQLLAQLVVAILGWGAAREDFRRAVVAEAERQGFELARVALEWKAAAAARPDAGARLKLRDGAAEIYLPGENPATRSRAADP